MNKDYDIEDADEGPRYRGPGEIDSAELRTALGSLRLLGDDPFLRMQAFSLSIVDPFVMRLEYSLLEQLNVEEHTPMAEAVFISAQSQMWIFAAYEIMRTWRQRAGDMIKWSEGGGLKRKLVALEKDVGYEHIGRKFRAEQMKRVLAEPSLIDEIKQDLRRIHMVFARMEAIRISIAKHEVSGRKHSVALRPGYGRINAECGSLDFELENGMYSMGYISRRDIADEIRMLPTAEVPTEEMIKEFDEYMRGRPLQPP